MLTLEIWHMICLALLFGYCALHNRKKGITLGIKTALLSLQAENVIVIRNGSIFPGNMKKQDS